MWLGALFHVSDAFLGACNASREPSYLPSWACVVVGACTETAWLLEEFRFRSITQTAHATAAPSRSSKRISIPRALRLQLLVLNLLSQLPNPDYLPLLHYKATCVHPTA